MTTIGDATEQYLDALVARHGSHWSADYRARFSAMVADVKAYQPGNPWERGNLIPNPARTAVAERKAEMDDCKGNQ